MKAGSHEPTDTPHRGGGGHSRGPSAPNGSRCPSPECGICSEFDPTAGATQELSTTAECLRANHDPDGPASAADVDQVPAIAESRLLAHLGTPGTVVSVTNSYAPKARADALVANLRRMPAPQTRATIEAPLANVLVLPVAPPSTTVPLVTRTIDSSGRISARIQHRTIADWLDWQPGAFTITSVDAWAVCHRLEQVEAPRRFSSSGTVCPDGRLRLPAAVLERLGTDAGGDLLIHVDPDRGFVAFCNPALIFNVAPLDFETRGAR